MEALSICGGTRLRGEVTISGAKNAALPILAACLLTGSECVLHNCPEIADVQIAVRILETLGCTVQREGSTVTVNARELTENRIPPELAGRMRASVLFQGALCARTGEAELTQPGGCRLGERPIDYHIAALRALGTTCTQTEEGFLCRKNGQGGGFFHLPYPSVGATENAILTAVCASGDSILRGCAREPEITDLCAFLSAAGAEITGAGTDTIFVRGGRSLHGAVHRLIPDRMEALTFLCACTGCGGEITLRATKPEDYAAERELLVGAGCEMKSTNDTLTLLTPEHLSPIPLAVTGPYPRLSTDAQPLLLAAMLRAQGVSRFCEQVFESRLGYTEELKKLGAELFLSGRYVRLTGGQRLRGSVLHGEDLRGSAALVIAALQAEGESCLTGLVHLNRGYSDFPGKLRALGAAIREMST